MAVDYVDLIGEFYPTIACVSSGDTNDYSAIVWESTIVPQPELDMLYITQVKTDKILEFSEYAREDITKGFASSALGFPHTYDAEPEDQLNLIGAAAIQADVVFSCYPASTGYQILDFGGSIVGTNLTGFMNDSTMYNAEVVSQGVSSYLSIKGQDAQTFDELLTQMNLDVDFSLDATAVIENGNIKISCNTYGTVSTINVLDAGLFAQLAGYVSPLLAIIGMEAKSNPKQYKNHTHLQLLVVLNDGKDVKLTVLQKFAVKKSQILYAVDEAAVLAITWM